MPKELRKTPLLEAIFELRFEPDAPAAGDLLPGLLYSVLKTQYPEVVPLPMAKIPRELRDRNPALLYQASHRLTGGPNSVQAGDRVISLHSTAYPGWKRFKEMGQFVIEAAKGTGLIKSVDRFSFKYVNLIDASETEQQLPLLNARIDLIGSAPLERGFLLRAELEDGDFITIIELMTRAGVKDPSSGKERSGLLVTVDTLRGGIGNEFLMKPSDLLEEGHSVAKNKFFSLLTESTLTRLEPVW